MGIINFIIVLSILVFVHELGHFLAARFFRVQVEAFSIGFGSMKLVCVRLGETEYSIRPIPLGGFVVLKGQSDSDPTHRNEEPDSLYGVARWKRLVILAAGSAFNLIFAFILYVCVGLLGKNELAPVVGETISGMPASNVLQRGDDIFAINNHPIQTWTELNERIQSSDGALLFGVLREGKEHFIEIMPQMGDGRSIFGEPIQKPLIGIRPLGEFRLVSYSFGQSLAYGFDQTLEASRLIVVGIGKMFEGIVPITEVGGVVSIGYFIHKATEIGIVAIFLSMAIISVNLGILNLLPIPALDGGHILFTCYEMVTKKIPNRQVMFYLTVGGWAILLALMALGLYNDISRMIHGTMPF